MGCERVAGSAGSLGRCPGSYTWEAYGRLRGARTVALTPLPTSSMSSYASAFLGYSRSGALGAGLAVEAIASARRRG